MALTGGPAGASAACWLAGQDAAPRPAWSACSPCSTAGSMSSCSATARTTRRASRRALLDLAYAARPAAGRHQRRALSQGRDVRGARRAAVHRSRARIIEDEAPPAHARALLQVGRRDAGGLRRPAGGLRQHPRRSPAAAPTCRCRASRSCRATQARAAAPRRTSCASMARDGPERRLRRRRPARRPTSSSSKYRERLELRARHDRADGLPRLLPDRRRLHPMGEGPRHPGRAGPRLGRGLAGRLVAQDHRSRSAALGPAVRALPQSRARVDAGLRHRLLPGPARPGDPLRAATSTAHDRVAADHHLRQAAGARGAARRRPRARHALRPGRPHLQAGAQQSGQAGDAWRRRSRASSS